MSWANQVVNHQRRLHRRISGATQGFSIDLNIAYDYNDGLKKVKIFQIFAMLVTMPTPSKLLLGISSVSYYFPNFLFSPSIF